MNSFSIFVIEKNFVQKVKRNFRGRKLKDFYSVTLESSEVSNKAELPFKKIQVYSETTVLDVIKQYKDKNSFTPFYSIREIEFIIEYGYILQRPQISQTPSDKSSKQNKHKINQYYQQKLKDLGISNNEVLILDTVEISRISTEERDLTLYCMSFPPTVVDFLDMVHQFPLQDESVLQMALLYTDADKELSSFIRETYSDIHVLSGANFKVYALEKVNTSQNFQEAVSYWKSLLSERLYIVWSSLGWLITKPYDKTQCYEIGRSLGIRPDQFPCLVLFDTPHPERVLIFPIVKPYIAFFRQLFDGLNGIIHKSKEDDSNDDIYNMNYKYNKRYNMLNSITQEYEKFRENLLKNSTVKNYQDRTKYVFKETAFFVNLYTEETTVSENYVNNFQGANIANMANTVRDNARQQANQHIYSKEKKTLAEAANEIQQLLKQLEQSNPSATEREKIAYVNDETTTNFKSRVVSALQAGGEAAIEEFLDNPYVNVGKAIVKGWIKPE